MTQAALLSYAKSQLSIGVWIERTVTVTLGNENWLHEAMRGADADPSQTCTACTQPWIHPANPPLRGTTDALANSTDIPWVDQFGLGAATVMPESKAPVSASPADPFPF